MSGAVVQSERNQDATIYVRNLDMHVTESILWELFLQSGPVANVFIPKDKVTGAMQEYGFVEMRSEADAEYAIKVMNMTRLFGKPIEIRKASREKKEFDVGANLFISNLDPEVDEKQLYDLFSFFGTVIATKVVKDEMNNSKGIAFVNFDNFDSSDNAIQGMDQQYISGRQVRVNYAYKKDSKGERHGTAGERLLAAKASKLSSTSVKPAPGPHPLFSSNDGSSGSLSSLPPTSEPPMHGAHHMPPPFTNNPYFGGPMPMMRPPPPMAGYNGHPGMPMMPMMNGMMAMRPPPQFPSFSRPPPAMHGWNPAMRPPPPQMFFPQ